MACTRVFGHSARARKPERTEAFATEDTEDREIEKSRTAENAEDAENEKTKMLWPRVQRLLLAGAPCPRWPVCSLFVFVVLVLNLYFSPHTLTRSASEGKLPSRVATSPRLRFGLVYRVFEQEFPDGLNLLSGSGTDKRVVRIAHPRPSCCFATPTTSCRCHPRGAYWSKLASSRWMISMLKRISQGTMYSRLSRGSSFSSTASRARASVSAFCSFSD